MDDAAFERAMIAAGSGYGNLAAMAAVRLPMHWLTFFALERSTVQAKLDCAV